MLSNEMKDSRNVERAISGYTSFILYRRTMKKPCIFIWFDLAYNAWCNYKSLYKFGYVFLEIAHLYIVL